MGQIRLEHSAAAALADGEIRITVTEKGKASPCRVTVVDSNGSLFPMLVDAKHSAVRPGVAYLGDGLATLHLPAGEYTLYVGRGFKYGVSTQRVSLGRKPIAIQVALKREV